MILELYAIYDKKLGEYLPPFCCKNEADAVRMCSNLVNHSDSLMLKFPDDYFCEKVAEFDTESSQCDSAYKDYDMKQVKIEFNTLVKDQTTKYKDILNKIESLSGVIDNKLMLLSDKINKLDSLPLEYTSKFDKLIDTYNCNLGDLNNKFDSFRKELDDLESESRIQVEVIKDNYKSVDTPDFLPTNNTPSKKSFLDKLFS